MVRETLSDRQTRIGNDLKRAEKLKEEALAAHSSFTSSLDDAKQQAHDVIGSARAKMEDIAKEKHAHLDDTFAKQQKEADARHAQLYQETVEMMEDLSTHLVQHTLKKLVNIEVDAQTAQQHLTHISPSSYRA